ncbi:MAG: hypothetical protein AB8B65_11095 [Kordia sp.]|uniref:hypothetical protein n=1 Tax=Kordia sp. TaxID=1965332 RepID=UPI0038593012
MKKRSIKNLALNKQLISNFEYSITGGLDSDSKTGGCNTITLILACPTLGDECPVEKPADPERSPSGN